MSGSHKGKKRKIKVGNKRLLALSVPLKAFQPVGGGACNSEGKYKNHCLASLSSREQGTWPSQECVLPWVPDLEFNVVRFERVNNQGIGVMIR